MSQKLSGQPRKRITYLLVEKLKVGIGLRQNVDGKHKHFLFSAKAVLIIMWLFILSLKKLGFLREVFLAWINMFLFKE